MGVAGFNTGFILFFLEGGGGGGEDGLHDSSKICCSNGCNGIAMCIKINTLLNLSRKRFLQVVLP